jgi:hypothetical protein
MACTLKNNSFVNEIRGGNYLTLEGKCYCGLFPYQHPEPIGKVFNQIFFNMFLFIFIFYLFFLS